MNADQERNSFFADTAVRQALMYAMDRDLIVNMMLDGVGTPAIGVQLPTSPAYEPDQASTVYTYDPEKAKSMLDAAGWTDDGDDGMREKDGVPFNLEFVFSDDAPVNSQLVPYLKQVFAEVGVEVLPKSLQAPTMMDQVISGDYEMATFKIFWTLDDQGVLYRCDAIPSDGFNLPRYRNPGYDRLNTEPQTELDPEARRQLMIDQVHISSDDAHWGLLNFGKSVVPMNPRVRNSFFSAFGKFWALTDTWITTS